MARTKLKLDTARSRHPIQAAFFFILIVCALVVVGYRIRGHFVKENFPGRVEGPEVHVSAVVRGRIHKIAVEPNMRVNEGQVIVELQDETITTQIEAAQSELGKLREDLAKVESEGPLFEQLFEINEKTATLEGDIETTEIEIEKLNRDIAAASQGLLLLQDHLRRSEILFEQKALVLSELEQRRLAVYQKEQQARGLNTDLKLAQSSLKGYLRIKEYYEDHTEGLRDLWSKDVSGIEISIKEKEGDLKVLLAEKEQLIIRSPTAGIVSRLQMAPGETAQPGDEILRISTGEDIWVETYLNSQRVASIVIGDNVFVHALGTRPIRLHGVVVGISPNMTSQPGYNPSPFEESTERIATAYVEFDDPEEAKGHVRPGQRVTVELLTQKRRERPATNADPG